MSIYIHIPFCNSICSYCDFCKVYYNKKYIYDYLDNLKKEISSRYKGEKVNTIFIGGGTPSSLDIDELRYLFDIIGAFDKDIYCEFTMECNIDSISEEKLTYIMDEMIEKDLTLKQVEEIYGIPTSTLYDSIEKTSDLERKSKIYDMYGKHRTQNQKDKETRKYN